MRQRYTAEQVAEALRYGKGMVSVAAKRLRCNRETISNYMRRYASVRQARDDARCELLDMAEIRLWEGVLRGDMTAVYFVLRTLGRSRGYGDRTEITGKDGGPVQHAHIHMWEERLQAAHARIAAHKAAILAQHALEAGHNGHPDDTTEEA